MTRSRLRVGMTLAPLGVILFQMARSPEMPRTVVPGASPHGSLLGAVLVLLALGCGRGALGPIETPEPRGRPLTVPDGPSPPVRPEVLHARVELFGLQIAALQSSFCPATPHRPATLETRVTAAPLVNVIRHTSGDAKTELVELAPQVSEYHFRDGDLLRHYEVQYRAGGYDYSYDNGGSDRRTGQSAVPEEATPHDLHSAMMLLRTWRPRLGEAAYFFIVLGRRLWRVDVTAAGPQVITSQGAPRLTHRIDGIGVRLWESAEAAPRRFSVWLSEDADRVPVRMLADASFGEVIMTLTDRELRAGNCSPVDVAAPEPPPTPGEPMGQVGRAWRTADTPLSDRARTR